MMACQYVRVSKTNATCRCCLGLNASVDVFARCESCGDASYASMLSICSAIPVTKDDELPMGICTACINNLIIAYTFKLNCKKAYNILIDELGISKRKHNVNISHSELPKIKSKDCILDDSNIINRIHSKFIANEKHSTKDFYHHSVKRDKSKNIMASHRKKMMLCIECGMKFKNKNDLKEHFKNCLNVANANSNKKKSKKQKYKYYDITEFKCALCKKNFTNERYLKKHIKKHISKLNNKAKELSSKGHDVIQGNPEPLAHVNLAQNFPFREDNGFNKLLSKFNSLHLKI